MTDEIREKIEKELKEWLYIECADCLNQELCSNFEAEQQYDRCMFTYYFIKLSQAYKEIVG